MRKASVLFAIIAIFFLTTSSFAHDWYPLACCSGHDCQPVDCTELIETVKGITYQGMEFTKDMIHPTQDKFCHVCYSQWPQGNVPHCVFTQPSS